MIPMVLDCERGAVEPTAAAVEKRAKFGIRLALRQDWYRGDKRRLKRTG